MLREAEPATREAPAPEPAPAEPAPVVDAGPLATASAVLAGDLVTEKGVMALQRLAGNAAVSRLLARQDGVYNPLMEEYEKARKERDEYVKSGKKGPLSYNPSGSNPSNYYGGFDVEYDPASGQLLVSLKGAVLFVAGMTLDAGGRAQPVEPSAQTAAAARAINRLKRSRRAAEVAKWSWSSAGGPDGTDETDFLAGFQSSIESGWRQKHPFYCTKQYWEDLGAETEVKVSVNKVDAAGGKGADQHMLVRAHKVPAGFVGGEADVSRSGGAGGSPFDNVMNLTSADVVPRKDELLERSLAFRPGKTLLTGGSIRQVWALAKDIPNAKPGATIAASNVSVKVQGKDPEQRQARFDTICSLLNQSAGFDASRATLVEDGEGDGAHITIGTGEAQTVAAHEAGHMFGLDDEYTGEGAYAPGKPTEHTDIAAAAGHTGAMHARSDSIMSGGKEVGPQHYVTFLDALKKVSGMSEWGQGAKRPVKPPSAMGDFPVPGTPGGGTPTGTAVV